MIKVTKGVMAFFTWELSGNTDLSNIPKVVNTGKI